MKKRIIFLFLSIAIMALIFYLSSMPASQSSQLSKPLAQSSGLSHETVRKTAHFLLFLSLSGSLFGFFSTFFKQANPYFFAFATTALYAATDEFHQYFVPGRSCELRDVLIDSAGALTFLLLWALFSFLFRSLKKR